MRSRGDHRGPAGGGTEEIDKLHPAAIAGAISSGGPRVVLDCPGRAPAPLAMMDAQITKVAELLHEAAETHHIVYKIVDGADDDWASWYGNWLVRVSELPQLLGKPPVRSELIYLLVRLDKEYIEREPPEAWETYYARAILEHFSRPRPEVG